MPEATLMARRKCPKQTCPKGLPQQGYDRLWWFSASPLAGHEAPRAVIRHKVESGYVETDDCVTRILSE